MRNIEEEIRLYAKVKVAQRMHGIFDKLKDILDTNINESRVI